MPSTPAWLAGAEALLNRWIGASTRATDQARRLNDTTLQIHIAGMRGVRAGVNANRIALWQSDAAEADAVISGTPLALLQLARGGKRTTGTAGVQIRGDAEIADLYRGLFEYARPDLEEELSRVIGDLPAHRISRFAQNVTAWARSARHTAGENIAEYLQEESRDLVSHAEHDEFLSGVDGLRETADRVEARLSRLEQRLKGMA